MKKKIIFVIAGIVLVILFFVGGRSFYLNKMLNYNAIVKDTINLYYVTEKTADLEPISELFEKYKGNDEVRNKIQEYSYEMVNDWFVYYTTKTVCDINNSNTCKAMASELEQLLPKISKLYNYREIDGYTIISDAAFELLESQINKKIEDIDNILKDPNAKRPLNEAEIRENKCNSTNDCTNCRDGVCTCTYTNTSGAKEELVCKKNM